MSPDLIRQRRDGTTLCTVSREADRQVAYLPGADASSSAFAFAARLRRSLDPNDDAIAAAWSARVVRRRLGSEGVQAYDDGGAWTVPMEETFANGFVAFLRGAAWGGPWPPEAAHWRTQLAAAMASCPDGLEGREAAQALDDTTRALYSRLVVMASKLGALPFGTPESTSQRPYVDPSGGSPVTFRKQTSTVGPSPEAVAAKSGMRPEPAIGFSTLDAPRPFRFVVPAIVIAGGLILLAVTIGILSFTAFRPGSADAAKAADATMAHLRAREFSKIYDFGSTILRRERWPEFGARVKRPESLGKMTELTAQGPPRIERLAGFGRTATVLYDATYVFGKASFVCRFVDVGLVGEWKLAEFDIIVIPDVMEPPFAGTADGADLLARRLLYAFQQSDYGTIETLVPGIEDRERIESFRNTLLGDGFITKIERTAYDEETIKSIVVQAATYTIETNRDQRSGTLRLLLVRDGSNWKVGGMETNMSFRN